jgi:hypothetical protein
MKYTAKSIGVHDPDRLLGRIFLFWTSTHDASNYAKEIDEIRNMLSSTHLVHFTDLSPHFKTSQGLISGWFAQQIVKLKVASLVTSDFYIGLDAKNTLIKGIQKYSFLTTCNQGKIQAGYRYDNIPEPHRGWYSLSAQVLNLSVPYKGYWPTSITPMVFHRQTVLDMLLAIGEGSNSEILCDGALCDAMDVFGSTGTGATEYTLYLLYARSRKDFRCVHFVQRLDPGSFNDHWAASLWRGVLPKGNADLCEKVALGINSPLMFGSQPKVLDGMTTELREQTETLIADIYRNAGLHKAGQSVSDLVECVIGRRTTATSTSTSASTSATSPISPPPLGFCCYGGLDATDLCGTCDVDTIPRPSEYCGQSMGNCKHCTGHWCSATGTVRI